MKTDILERHVSAAIIAAQGVCKDLHWCRWAEKWLRATDRTAGAAEEAARAVGRCTGILDDVDVADRVMKKAAKLVSEGLDPEMAMDDADLEFEELQRQEDVAFASDQTASARQWAGQAAQLAAQAAVSAAHALSHPDEEVNEDVAGITVRVADAACAAAAVSSQSGG